MHSRQTEEGVMGCYFPNSLRRKGANPNRLVANRIRDDGSGVVATLSFKDTSLIEKSFVPVRSKVIDVMPGLVSSRPMKMAELSAFLVSIPFSVKQSPRLSQILAVKPPYPLEPICAPAPKMPLPNVNVKGPWAFVYNRSSPGAKLPDQPS